MKTYTDLTTSRTMLTWRVYSRAWHVRDIVKGKTVIDPLPPLSLIDKYVQINREGERGVGNFEGNLTNYKVAFQ